MKLITAIVRPERLNDVLAALFTAEVRGLTNSRAQGHGGGTRAARTGETGAGKIFFVPVERVVRVRTGEENQAAVTAAVTAAACV